MVKIEILVEEGKAEKIRETELQRYLDFFRESYKDNMSHSNATITSFPRWSIISGYYAMHNISKLLIAVKFRLKITKEAHSTTIKVIRENVRDRKTVEMIEKGYDEFRRLADELNEAKKERVRAQYYTGTVFMKKRFEEEAAGFNKTSVRPYIEKISRLIENDY